MAALEGAGEAVSRQEGLLGDFTLLPSAALQGAESSTGSQRGPRKVVSGSRVGVGGGKVAPVGLWAPAAPPHETQSPAAPILAALSG